MPAKTQLSKEAVGTEECGWRELSETSSEEEAAPAMPPMLAGLHRPHPGLVFPLRKGSGTSVRSPWDVELFSVLEKATHLFHQLPSQRGT